MIGAVAIASSLIVAVTSAIGTVQDNVELSLRKILGSADARIIHQFNGRFDERWLETVRDWPEVQDATGRLGGSLALGFADDRVDPETSRPPRLVPRAIGVEFDLERDFRPVTLQAGAWPQTRHEILIDPMCAEALHATVGDELLVRRIGAPMRLTVAGIYERRRLGFFQRPQLRIDRQTLAEAAGHPGQISSILIHLRDGMDVGAFCAQHLDKLPTELAIEPAEMAKAGFDRRVEASRIGFIVASVLVFMSASFIIVTAMTTAVTQRQREMAVIRCLGGARRQLFAAQLAIGSIVGGVGGLLGIPIGIGLAAFLAWWFADLLPAGLSINGLGIELGLVGAVLCGLCGAVYPAWEASRTPPLQAMTVQARPVRRRSILVCLLLGAACLGGQWALTTPADASSRFWLFVCVGMPLLFVGYFILAVPVLLAVNLLLSPLLCRACAVPADLLRRAVLATPFRDGFTAGALMVGLAILVASWAEARTILDDWIGPMRFPDGLAVRRAGLEPEQQQAIAALPFVANVCPIGQLPVQILDRRVFGVEGLTPREVALIGFDAERFFQMNAITWAAGDPDVAIRRLKDGDAIIVADRFLRTGAVRLGDRLTLGAGRVHKDFEIVGAVSSAGLDIATQLFGIRSRYMEYSISCVFMDAAAVAEHFGNREAYLLQIDLRGDVTDEEVSEAIADAAPGVFFFSGRWIKESINQIALIILTLDSTIAFAALVLATVGMGSVILANLRSRRYEFGVLRAVGAPRGQLGRLILAEATLLAGAASVTGVLLGLHLAWAETHHYRDLLGLPARLVIPALPAAIGCAVLLLMTLTATIPGVWSIVRPRPSVLLAPGRTG